MTTMPSTLQYISSVSTPPQETKNTNVFLRMISYVKAKKQASRLKHGLNEVKDIRSGKIKAVSFDEFLSDL
jgi:hypothetical protein